MVFEAAAASFKPLFSLVRVLLAPRVPDLRRDLEPPQVERRDEGARLRDCCGRAALQVGAVETVLVIQSTGLDDPDTVSPLKHARLREWVLGHSWDNLGDQINSLFDVFLLARLIVAGRRSGPLAALRRVLGSKDLTRVIAKFLVLKLEPGQG